MLHSRLSIIDLDARSNQPLNVGSRWIALNGELYNYVELRAALERTGRRFRTESDTEVLLQMIDSEGWSVLDRCEGMWAFAVYDESDGSLTLSRDRFGEKPLYLFRDGSDLYFASEVKFIVALLGRRLEVNHNHLYRYLVNGYRSLYKVQERFFGGLEELPPGSVLRLDRSGEEHRHRYWEPRHTPDEQMTYQDAVAGVRDRLVRAVELRLRADVPLAFCMSGGVDSVSLLSVAKRVFDYDVHGFTVVNTDARYDEQDMVRLAVATLGIRHTPIPVGPEGFLDNLRLVVRQHDAPVITITYYAHWLLMRSIAENGYRVSISGTAADELFTGYYDHHLAYLYEVRNEPEHYAPARAAWETHIQPVVRNPYLSQADAFVRDPGMRDHLFFNAAGFADYLVRPWREAFEEKTYSGSLLRNRMLNEMFHENVPVILHEDDLNAMYFSIENRSPFLDRRLFEFCFQIPSRHLIRDGYSKAILRDAMRGVTPEPILETRRKVGFNAPVLDFVDVGNPRVREYLLDQSPVFDHVRRDRIESLTSKPDLPNSESKFLFYFISAKMFLEEFAA